MERERGVGGGGVGGGGGLSKLVDVQLKENLGLRARVKGHSICLVPSGLWLLFHVS